MIVAALIAISFWGGAAYQKRKMSAELSANQKITLKAQKCLKESLKNQLNYINFANLAHEKVVDDEMERER